MAGKERKFYEEPPSPRAWSREQPYGTIDLDDLNDWLRRPRPRQSRARRHTEDSIQQAQGSPSFVVEKPESFREFADDASTKTPEIHYDQNFLHPPTPKRDSFVTVGLAAERSGYDDDTAELRPRRRSVNLEQSSRFGWWTLGLFVLTVVMVTLTAIFSDGSAKSLWQDKFFTTSPSNAILILRIMTEACALLLGGLIMVVVEDLQWALASRPQGLGLLHFVGLDSGTGVWGLVRLLATADWSQKYSSLFR